MHGPRPGPCLDATQRSDCAPAPPNGRAASGVFLRQSVLPSAAFEYITIIVPAIQLSFGIGTRSKRVHYQPAAVPPARGSAAPMKDFPSAPRITICDTAMA